MISHDSEVTVSGSSFSDNSSSSDANSYGGTLMLKFGSLVLEDSQITGSRIIGGEGYGGAIHSISASLTLTNSQISDAQIDGKYSTGGAINIENGELSIANSVIDKSIAGSGGALYAKETGIVISESFNY